jgi:cytochrome c2
LICSAHGRTLKTTARASIARGQAVFNSKTIPIEGVAGLNDVLGQPSFSGTCGTCHDAPNVGDHSVSAPLNIGVSDVSSPLDAGYLPVVTLQNNSTGERVRTTDPGRALITGLWVDIGKVKGPILRGFAARAPYFHNGSASGLSDVVTFYQKRFNGSFTDQDKADLIAFLKACRQWAGPRSAGEPWSHLAIAATAALTNPAGDPVALLRPTGTTPAFAVARNILSVPAALIPAELVPATKTPSSAATPLKRCCKSLRPISFSSLRFWRQPAIIRLLRSQFPPKVRT